MNLIAIDAGGTKTEALLFNEQGTVLRRELGEGMNPLNIGFDTACTRCAELIRRLGPADAVYCGIAGIQYFDGAEQTLRRMTGIEKLKVEADGMMLISAELGHADGASMICGTGSGMYVRMGDAVRTVGGWGWLIGGGGSGYLLGLRAVQAAIDEADGTGEKTLLSDLIAARCGERAEKHIAAFYQGGRPYFASFASAVFEARAAGDAAAQRIFDRSIGELVKLVQPIYRDYGAFTLVLNGGIFAHYPEYAEELKRLTPPDIRYIFPKRPPVCGAAVEAMHLMGLHGDEAFRSRLTQNLEHAGQ